MNIKISSCYIDTAMILKQPKTIWLEVCTLDKHQTTEEPDEVKISRPVLKTSRSGDGAA